MTAINQQQFKNVIEALRARRGMPPATTKPAQRMPTPLTASIVGAIKVVRETPAEKAKLEAALAHISSDVPRGIGKVFSPDGQPAADCWLGVVWALAGLGWASGEDLARDWSRRSPRFTEQGFADGWRGFNPQHANAVGIGSVYKLARAKGWDGRAVVNSPPIAGRYKLLGRNDIQVLPANRWRVKGLLPEGGVAAIYGASGSGKSFVAKDMGIRVARGDKWFGHKTHACSVTYIMLEGEGGLKSRIDAWEMQNGNQIPDTFKVITQPIELTTPECIEALGASLPKDGVVIIDTLNRAAPTADENSSQDMGAILQGLKRLQTLTGGLVIVVHHTGKDKTKGARGHSSFFAALDAAIEVDRTAEGRSWRAAKVKDGEDGKSTAFSLKVHVLGQDSDGDEITSCAIDPNPGTVFSQAKPPPTGKNQKAALAAVRKALGVSTDLGKGGSSPKVPCILVEVAVQGVAKDLIAMASNRRSNAARTQVQGLISGGFLGAGVDGGDEWLWER